VTVEISVTIEIVASEVMTAGAHGVASKSMSMKGVSRRQAVSAQRMTTPTMTHVRPATMGGKPMKPAASAVKSSASAVKAGKSMEPTAAASTVKATASTSTVKAAATASTVTTTSSVTAGDCRDVRHEAKRAHRDARCQNAYCFPLHVAFPNRSPKPACNAREPAYLYLTAVSAPSF
jgi:hypothetical protein